jgi:hypothetical protein
MDGWADVRADGLYRCHPLTRLLSCFLPQGSASVLVLCLEHHDEALYRRERMTRERQIDSRKQWHRDRETGVGEIEIGG